MNVWSASLHCIPNSKARQVRISRHMALENPCTDRIRSDAAKLISNSFVTYSRLLVFDRVPGSQKSTRD
jgi:hypothetical protein